MKKRTLALLLGTLMAAAVACSGCGNKQEETTKTQTTTTQTATTGTQTADTQTKATNEETTPATDTAGTTTAKTIQPMGSTVPEQLTEGTYRVAIDTSDVTALADTNAGMSLTCNVYTEEIYDIVDINQMAVGDTIVIRGETVNVKSIDKKDDGSILINGGLDKGGAELRTEADTNGYISYAENDTHSYTDQGVRKVDVSDTVVLTDKSDPQTTVTKKGKEIVDYIMKGGSTWSQLNTEIVVDKTGMVVEINKYYMP